METFCGDFGIRVFVSLPSSGFEVFEGFLGFQSLDMVCVAEDSPSDRW